jgi:hypothetical protein
VQMIESITKHDLARSVSGTILIRHTISYTYPSSLHFPLFGEMGEVMIFRVIANNI